MSTTAPQTAEQNGDSPIPLPAEREPASLYRYSTWLHAGAGSERCAEVDEANGVNTCGDHSHFHAWCRLPNPLQQAELRQRALAAKARKIRQLRDPETDAYAIIEEEFDVKRREGELARDGAIEELLALDFYRDYFDAMQEVRQIEVDRPMELDDDADELPKLYAHIEDDQRRLLRLEGTPEDERPKDEYEELKRHLSAYNEAIDAALKQRTEPKRQALDGLDTESLLEQLRDKRIESEALREFQRVFEIHEWLSCAYRQPDGPPVLQDLELLERAAPEVIEALQATFTDLKRTAQEAQGN